MKNLQFNHTTKILSFMVALMALALFSACGGSGFSSFTQSVVPQAPVAAAPGFVQVEQLARPAINEGVFLTDAFLTAYNSLTPAQVVGVLGDSTNGVTQEAVTVLGLLGGSSPPARVGDVVTALFPDVLRIDTAIASPVGTQAYANAAVPVGSLGVVMPRAGRKIEDEVIHVTLSLLTNGGLTTDHVTYNSNSSNTVPAANNPAQGHHLLTGQSAPNGAATFPFLAPPN